MRRNKVSELAILVHKMHNNNKRNKALFLPKMIINRELKWKAVVYEIQACRRLLVVVAALRPAALGSSCLLVEMR